MVGVLALQGNFASHIQILNDIGIDSTLVKNLEDLSNLQGLILPGGESTTMSNLLLRDRSFIDGIKSFSDNKPIFGTCAGLILMSKNSFDKKVLNMNILDIEVDRNVLPEFSNITQMEKILEGTDWMAKKSQGAPKRYDAFAGLKEDSSKERPSTKKLNELF